jgi:hypothetical protein
MFKFQDVFSAPTNSIIEFVLDYESVPSAEEQAKVLLDYVLKTLSQDNKKVAITYSANNKQAKKYLLLTSMEMCSLDVSQGKTKPLPCRSWLTLSQASLSCFAFCDHF